MNGYNPPFDLKKAFKEFVEKTEASKEFKKVETNPGKKGPAVVEKTEASKEFKKVETAPGKNNNVSPQDIPFETIAQIAEFNAKPLPQAPSVFGPRFFNAGTLVNDNTHPDVWPMLKTSLQLDSTNFKYIAWSQPSKLVKVDHGRLYTGNTWTTSRPLNAQPGSQASLLLMKDLLGPQQNYGAPNGVTIVTKDFVDVVKLPFTLEIKDEIVYLNENTFSSLYENNNMAERLVSLYYGTPSYTVKVWANPSGLGWSLDNTVHEPDPSTGVGTIVGDKNTCVKESFLFRVPPNTPNDTGPYRDQLQALRYLRTKVAQSSGATNGMWYDHVCEYDTPAFTDNFQEITSQLTTERSLKIESSATYNYYKPGYEKVIAPTEFSHNSLPDYNIMAAHQRWSPSQKAMLETFDNDESMVNNSDFNAYYKYVSLEAQLDSDIEKPFANYGSLQGNTWYYLDKWTKVMEAGYPNQWFDKKYSNLTFPAFAMMDHCLKELPGGTINQYPMFNHIRLKLPNSKPVSPNTTEDSPMKWNYKMFTGVEDGIKRQSLDLAYLSRFNKYQEGTKAGGPQVYPTFVQGDSAVNPWSEAQYWKDLSPVKGNYVQPYKSGLEWKYTTTGGHDGDLHTAMDFIKFLGNLLKFGSRLYGYTYGLLNDPWPDSLPFLMSNNKNVEVALQMIEPNWIGGHNNTLDNWLDRLTPYLRRTRSFSEILEGKLAPSITLGFKILKYGFDAQGNRTPDPISTYFLSNTNDLKEQKNKYFDFYDTRVKYGEKYQYDIVGLHLILGTRYAYTRVDNRVAEADPASRLVENPWHKFTAEVTSWPDIKIVELPYQNNIVLRMMDKPPLAPEIEPVPFKGVDNKLLWLIRPQYGSRKEVPISILPQDTGIFNKQYEAQYGGVVGQGEFSSGTGQMAEQEQWAEKQQGFAEIGITPLEFKGDDLTQKYQMFRLSTPPKSYGSFANAELITEISSERSTSTSFLDTLTPNHKYYYTFRSIDVHNNLSNPSPIYEIELINDLGTIYIVTKIYDFPTEVKVGSKSAKRFIAIQPALSQRLLNMSATGLESGENGEMTTDGKSMEIKLGLDNELLFGGNKRIKIRLNSKKTNRKIDFNLDFNLKNVQTEESLEPDEWKWAPDSATTGQIPASPPPPCGEGQIYNDETGECEDIVTTPEPDDDKC